MLYQQILHFKRGGKNKINILLGHPCVLYILLYIPTRSHTVLDDSRVEHGLNNVPIVLFFMFIYYKSLYRVIQKPCSTLSFLNYAVTQDLILKLFRIGSYLKNSNS